MGSYTSKPEERDKVVNILEINEGVVDAQYDATNICYSVADIQLMAQAARKTRVLRDLNTYHKDSLCHIQIIRKMQILKNLKDYFVYADDKTIYHKYILGTVEYETVDSILRVYQMNTSFIYNLFRAEIYNNNNSFNFFSQL